MNGKYFVENGGEWNLISTGKIRRKVFHRGCGWETVCFVENLGENVEIEKGTF